LHLILTVRQDDALLAPLLGIQVDALERRCGEQVVTVLPARDLRRMMHDSVRHAIRAVFSVPARRQQCRRNCCSPGANRIPCQDMPTNYQPTASISTTRGWRNTLLAYRIERSTGHYTLIDTIVRDMNTGPDGTERVHRWRCGTISRERHTPWQAARARQIKPSTT
jgi:hypothetical protein